MRFPTSTPTLSPTEAARQVVLTPELLHATREQTSSAALLTSMMATSEQQDIISRARQALTDSLSLAEHVRLIGRLYHHTAAVYEARAAKSPQKGPQLHGEEPLHLVLLGRRDYLYQVSQELAAV